MPSSRKPFAAIALSVAVIGASILSPTDVSADSKTSFLAEQLRKNGDYRVRTNAALSLGTSDDAGAVKPLCDCLDDGSEVETVRVACAAALGKLGKYSSGDCLKSHADDSSSKVKEQVATSLKAVGGGGSTASMQCPTSASTSAKPKYYLGVDVTNKSTRPDSEIKPMIAKEFRCRLQALGRFKLAPDGQTAVKDMTTVVTKEKLDGYYLSLTVDPIKYDGGSLKINISMAIASYDRNIIGTAGKSLTEPGVSSPSKSEEDDLLKTASQKLADSFADLKQ